LMALQCARFGESFGAAGMSTMVRSFATVGHPGSGRRRTAR
jgi:hypothetical protein